MAAKKTTAKTTIDALLTEMRKAPAKTHTVSDLIVAVGRGKGTVYSTIYGEAKREHARVVQVERGTFKLTAAGRKAAKAS